MIKALGYGGYKEFRYTVVERLAAGSTNTAGFEEYGITPSFDEVREPMGMLKKDHIRTMMNMDRIRCEWKRIHGRDFTEDDVEEVYQTSEKSILKIVHKFADPKPFVIDTVGYLRDHGIKIGSTTGYTDEMMDIVVPEAAASMIRKS